MRCALIPAHTGARTHNLQEDHLVSKLACSAQLPSCRSRRSLSLSLHLNCRRDTCREEPIKQNNGQQGPLSILCLSANSLLYSISVACISSPETGAHLQRC